MGVGWDNEVSFNKNSINAIMKSLIRGKYTISQLAFVCSSSNVR